MEKPQKISRGMNLGGSGQMDKLSDYYYTGSLDSIYSNPQFQWHVLSNHVEFSQIYYAMKWASEISEDEFENMSVEARMQKNISNLTGEHKKILKDLIENSKNYNESFLRKIQEFYEITSDGEPPAPAKIIDGKMVLEDRPYLMHNIPITTLEDIKSRKELGILASEWFGKPEFAGECRFCASFFKTDGKAEEERSKTSTPEEKGHGMLTFIFDTSSPDLQQLLHLDFFEYLRKKEAGDLSEYSEGELKFLSRLEEWNGGGENNQDDILKTIGGGAKRVAQMHKNWCMIPGGMPSKYVIAIMAQGIEPGSEQEKLALEAGKIFGVPVINSNHEVLKGKESDETKNI